MAHLINVTLTNGQVMKNEFTYISINADRIIKIEDIGPSVRGDSKIILDTNEVFEVNETRKQLVEMVNAHLKASPVFS